MLLNRRDMIVKTSLLTAGLFVGCKAGQNSILRIGTVLWPGCEPLFMARDLEYFDPSIQLIEYPSGPDVHRSFQNRAIEAAAVRLDDALLLAEQQPDIRAIMAIDFSNGADALLARPEINGLAELKGRRVGVELNSVGAFILNSALDRAGLSPSDIEIVPLSSGTIEVAFREEAVDAVVVSEPKSLRLRKAGARVLFDSTQMPGEIIDVLIVRESILREQRDRLVSLLRGWFWAVEKFQRRSSEALSFAAVHEEITPDQFDIAQSKIEFLDLARNRSLFTSPDGALPDRVRKLSASLKKYGMLNQMIDPSLLLNSSILEQIRS